MGFVAPQNLGSSWTGIESVSPALVGRFFTTEPLGSPIAFFFMTDIPLSVCVCTHTPHLHLSRCLFFFCWVVWVVFMFCIVTPYHIYCLQLSPSRSVGCLFVLLVVSFAVQKLFSFWCSTICLVLFLFPFSEEICPPKLLSLVSKEYTTWVFFWKFYGFKYYLFLSLKSIWVYFCIRSEKVGQFDSFTCSSPVFPTPFIEEAVFSPVYILASWS